MYIFMMFNAEQQGCSTLVIMASCLYGILTKLWRKAVFVLNTYSSVCRTFEYSKVSVRVIIKSGHYWLTSPHSQFFSALPDDNMQWYNQTWSQFLPHIAILICTSLLKGSAQNKKDSQWYFLVHGNTSSLIHLLHILCLILLTTHDSRRRC